MFHHGMQHLLAQTERFFPRGDFPVQPFGLPCPQKTHGRKQE